MYTNLSKISDKDAIRTPGLTPMMLGYPNFYDFDQFYQFNRGISTLAHFYKVKYAIFLGLPFVLSVTLKNL